MTALNVSLEEALQKLTIADLKELIPYLPDSGKAGSRKDELVERIVDAMQGATLQSIWKKLDPMQAAAVAEAIYDAQGEFSHQRFQAIYQCLPAFEVSNGKARSYSGGKKSTLALFIHYGFKGQKYFVPCDLRERLLAFVAEPPMVGVDSSETPKTGPGLIERHIEREALQEVVVVLRTVERERIVVSEKTALPSSAALKVLGQKLVGGDLYPVVQKDDEWGQVIGPIKAFAWPLLLQAGGLAQRNGTRLTLSVAGVKALSAPPSDVLRTLWRKWLNSTLLDEFSRIDVIKGQNSAGRVMTAVAPRRAAIEAALLDCPVGRWVSLDGFSRFMQAKNHLFEVTHDPWKLYLFDRQYGSLGYAGSHDWNIVQKRYLSAVLMEYAATLGMIDLSYRDPGESAGDFREMWGADELRFLSRYDGLDSFRITDLGAYVLGLVDVYQPVAPTSDVALSVLPSLHVKLVHGSLSAEAALMLELWTDPLEADTWELSRTRAVEAIEKGYDIGVLRAFLESNSDQPLPELVDAFLLRCARDGHALKAGPRAVLIECRDAVTAEAVAMHKETSSLCLRAGPATLVVRDEHMEKFRERVHVLGLGLVH